MKKNIIILVAGFVTVSAGLIMKLQVDSDFADPMLLMGMVAEAYGAIALSVQVWKRLSEG